jgi:hypothetical protein
VRLTKLSNAYPTLRAESQVLRSYNGIRGALGRRTYASSTPDPPKEADPKANKTELAVDSSEPSVVGSRPSEPWYQQMEKDLLKFGTRKIASSFPITTHV